ncbi:YkgJ family cysteine cluster protein [Vibrio pomeroyi]|uniref:YkgJ family cysteine cluster protein n=1 Tax=Vibrio pomeroyi TaxID=198832 RepID=UPI0035A663E0
MLYWHSCRGDRYRNIDIVAKAGIDLDIDWSAKSSVGSNRPTEIAHCSLLDARTATCKAYKYRPLQCRLFSSFDHFELCEDPLGEHYTHRASSSPFWNLMLGNVALASHQAAAERDITAVADMRDWIAQQ